MIRRWLLPLLLLAGCGARAPQPPDRVYDSLRLQFRQGKLREALAEADRALRNSRSYPEPAWRSRFLLLKSEILVALEKPAEALKTLEDSPLAGVEEPEIGVRWRVLRARSQSMLRNFQDAGRLSEQALRLAAESGGPALRAEVELMRTAMFSRISDWSAAEVSAREAVELAHRSRDPYLVARALSTLGTRRRSTSRYDEAVPWYEQSLAVSDQNGFRFISAIGRHNLGICYFRIGDYDKALDLFSRADREYAEVGDLVGQGKVSGDIGNVYLRRGEFARAISVYRKALDRARQSNDADDMARWQNNLAGASIESGELDSAEASIREVLALREKNQNEQGTVWALLNSARIAAGRSRFDEAERVYGQTIESAGKLGMNDAVLQARSRLGSLFLQRGDSGKAEAEFRTIASQSDSRRTRLSRTEWKLTYQSSVIPFYQDYVEFLMSRGRTAEALEIAESCRARVLMEKLGLERKAVGGWTVADFRARARAERAVLLSYWLAPRGSFLWVVTPETVRSFSLPPQKEISAMAETYRDLIGRMRDPMETANPTGLRLFEVLVAPARELVPPGAKVIVVPDGALHELNFETLLVSGEPPRYWIEEATLAVAPSLGVLQPAHTSISSNGKRLLLLGSPVAPAPEYPPLPGSELEIASIEKLFRAGEKTVVSGPQAHPDAYREANPGNFAFIHFSAHAVANRESPLDSAVILSRKGDGYKLYARDVAATPLRAELVTISACRSAGARAYSGEGLVGFAWAFLQAGARNVIAGLWDVSDRSTAEVMAGLYSKLDQGLGPAAALRAAKLALLRSGGAYRKPYYWAPFQLYTWSGPFQDRLVRAAR